MGQSWSRPYSAVAFHHIVGEPVTRQRRLRGEGRGLLQARGRGGGSRGRSSPVHGCLVRRLAYRQGAGIEVTLLWHRTTGELAVSVTDAASGAWFELPVVPDEALASFHHPYAYAAAQGVPY
jgi:hypothetical protein